MIPTPLKKLDRMIKNGNWKQVEDLLLSREVMALPYAQRNYPFMTSSKVKEFLRCQFCYKTKHIDLIDDPTETDTQKDHFLIGQAFDDLLTHGKEKFEEKYEVVARRKDDAEKVQLTNTHSRLVEQMEKEFKAVSIFNHKPKKKLFFWEFGGFLIKVELDDFDGEVIRDIKTCSNVKTFDPGFYTLQAAFYQLVVEECTGKRPIVEYEIVDKYTYFSRSKPIRYSDYTLHSERGRILTALEEMKAAHETGIFGSAQNQEDLYDCPYYGHLGHGRPTQFIPY